MLERFREFNQTFPENSAIQEWSRKGRKIFGWLCTYIPEEVIHAAGALPIRVTGYGQEVQLDDGNAYLTANTCSFSRSCLQMGVRGGYEFLEGVAAGSTCDGARRLFDQWSMYLKTPFRHVLSVPRKSDEKAQRLYCGQVTLFKEHLEDFLHVTISDDSLRHSIEVYNESRDLLRRLYELRKRDNPPITGAETMEVLNASFRMPKETFNAMLSKLLDELASTDRGYPSRVRLMLAGSVMTNPEFLRSIEETGALIVVDELCTSTRYWSDPVVLDGSASPLEAISRRYLSNFPCARMTPAEDRFDRVLKLATDFRVDGVISEIIRYCVPYAHDLPLFTERLMRLNIPTLSLDLEYGSSGSGQIRTRVQAFVEMLEARRR